MTTTATILDRLQVCNAEIAGIVRSFRLPPVATLLPDDMPAAIIIPRALLTSTPDPQTGAGSYIVSRLYTIRILVTPAEMATIDEGDSGAKALSDCAPYLDSVLDYYLAHPQLDTVAGAAELWLVNDVRVQSSEILYAAVPGPGGAQYFGVDTALIVNERRLDIRLS